MKSISASATFISLLLGLAALAPSKAADYYIYHDADVGLINFYNKPSLGSRILRQCDLLELSKTQVGETSSGPNIPSASTGSK